MTTTKPIEQLVQEYKAWYAESAIKETENVITVDEVVVRVASFYEKIRGIVDWREEHLLRKTAIERILKRRMFVSKFDEDFAEQFLSELVRGGHFPNRRIPLEKVDEIQGILEKYVFVLQDSENIQLQDWLFSIAAVEIEEALSVPRREKALIELMTNDLAEKIEIGKRKNSAEAPPEEEQTLQIFVAVQRALFMLDNATITFHILERFYPDWKNPSAGTLEHVRNHVESLKNNIERIFKHLHAEKFYQMAEKHDTPYLLLHDVLSADPEKFEELLQEPHRLEEEIRQAYNHRHARLRGRLKRAALYSTISIFITKILIGIAGEIPIERYLGQEFNPIALAISIIIPPMLMLVLVMTVRTTSKNNFERVTIEVMKIITPREEKDVYNLNLPKKRTGTVVGLVYGFYAFSFLFSFGLATLLLQRLNFSVISIFIFLVFLSLVLFGATRIRQRAAELMIEPERENFLYNLFDMFSLPMIQVGRVLSRQISRYNILILGINFLIEVPFQMFVEFLDQWRSFLREKKDEIH